MAASGSKMLGGHSLGDVHRESALHLMNRVKYTTDPPGDSFIQGFDSHIAAALPKIGQTLPKSSWARGDIIEIQGPPASGKTHLLYFWAMTCVLPYRLSVRLERSQASIDVLLGGRDKSVIVCDCDARWSLRRLHAIMSAYLRERLSSTVSEQTDSTSSHMTCIPTVSEIVERALKRIHIFRPTSTISLATTLMALPVYHRSRMPEEEIGMLMVDSLSAFFWSDRWAAEQAEQASQLAADLPPAPDISTSAVADKPPPLRSDANPLRHVLTAILQLRRSLGMVTFLTNWGLTTLESQVPSSITYFRQHLRAPYPSPFDADPARSKFPLVHHITIPSQGPPPFDTGTALQEAVEDQEREELLKRLKLRALVRTIAKRPGEVRTIAESEFEFAITENSVLVL